MSDDTGGVHPFMSKQLEQRAKRKAVAKSVEDGLTLAAAAREHGVAVNTAWRACQEFEVEPKGQKRQTTIPHFCHILWRLLYTNDTHQSIADDLGLSTTLVAKILRGARDEGFRFPTRQDRKNREQGVA